MTFSITRRACLVLAASVLLFAPSCAWWKHLTKSKKEEKEKKAPQTELVGRVASISSSGGFVLIQSYGSWQVPTGTPLMSGTGDQIAALLATGEKMGQFAAADIRAGTPAVGDPVYWRKALTTPAPENPSAPDPAKPQNAVPKSSAAPADSPAEAPPNRKSPPESPKKAPPQAPGEAPGSPKLPEY